MPKGRMTTVTDLRTGITYPSMVKAANELPVSYEALREAHRKGRNKVGCVPLKFGAGEPTRHEPRQCQRLDTFKIYPSAKEAAKELGTAENNVSTACKHGRKCKGIEWRYL